MMWFVVLVVVRLSNCIGIGMFVLVEKNMCIFGLMRVFGFWLIMMVSCLDFNCISVFVG